jgi:hypothetical protein
MDIDISGWKKYLNTELGFEFRYPSEGFVNESTNNILKLRSSRPSLDGVRSSLVVEVAITDEEQDWMKLDYIGDTLDKHLDFASLKKHFGDNVKGDFYGDPPRGTYLVAFLLPDQNSKGVIFSFDIHQLNEPVYGGSFEDQKTATRILSTFRFIDAANDSLKILSPNGGEVLKTGEIHEITWEAYGVEEVYISLVNGGKEFGILATVPAAQGRYEWTVPDMSGRIESGLQADNFKIFIHNNSATNDVRDYSDGTFIITE